MNKKNFHYISPICQETPNGRICTKFGTGGRLVDVTISNIFVNGSSDLQGIECCHSPLTWAVTVNTVLLYHMPVTSVDVDLLWNRP